MPGRRLGAAFPDAGALAVSTEMARGPPGPGMVRSVWAIAGSERMDCLMGAMMVARAARCSATVESSVGSARSGMGGRREAISGSMGGAGWRGRESDMVLFLRVVFFLRGGLETGASVALGARR